MGGVSALLSLADSRSVHPVQRALSTIIAERAGRGSAAAGSLPKSEGKGFILHLMLMIEHSWVSPCVSGIYVGFVPLRLRSVCNIGVRGVHPP